MPHIYIIPATLKPGDRTYVGEVSHVEKFSENTFYIHTTNGRMMVANKYERMRVFRPEKVDLDKLDPCNNKAHDVFCAIKSNLNEEELGELLALLRQEGTI